MLNDFKKFILRGSVVDLAVGVVIGTAFTAIVNSLVADIIMPIIGAIFGGIDFTDLTVTINGSVIAYGNFIQALVSFLLIALTVFLAIRGFLAASETMGMDTSELGLEGIVGDEEEEPKPEPEPSDEAKLLVEIRDLLASQN